MTNPHLRLSQFKLIYSDWFNPALRANIGHVGKTASMSLLGFFLNQDYHDYNQPVIVLAQCEVSVMKQV